MYLDHDEYASDYPEAGLDTALAEDSPCYAAETSRSAATSRRADKATELVGDDEPSATALGQYIASMGRTRLLTADEEVSLAQEIEAGYRRALHALVRFPAIYPLLFTRFEAWLGNTRNVESPLRDIKRRPVPKAVHEQLGAAAKFWRAYEAAVGEADDGMLAAGAAQSVLVDAVEALPLSVSLMRTLAEEARGLFHEVRSERRGIFQRCVQTAGMPQSVFTQRFAGHETDLEWSSREGRRRTAYARAIRDQARHIEQHQRRLRQLEVRSRMPIAAILALAREVAAGEARAIRARDQMIEANLRLAVSIAKRYATPTIALADLIQEANLGLMKAVERYDYRKGFRFSTYATCWIRQSVSRHVANYSRHIRVPSHLHDDVGKVRRAQATLTQQLGRKPSATELAGETGLTEKRLRMMAGLHAPVSLQGQIFDDRDTQLADRVQTDEPALADQLAKEQGERLVRAAVGSLEPRRSKLISLRYGLGTGRDMMLQEIADRFGLSRERIRQLERSALETLREGSEQEQLLEALASYPSQPE